MFTIWTHRDQLPQNRQPEGQESQPPFAIIHAESHLEPTHALMDQQAMQVSLLQAEYEERKRALEETEEKLRLAQQALFETKATFAPIGRMPTELLGLIFIAHVKDNKQSPWTLMQISRRWRSVAMITRAIWGQILLANKKWTKSNGVPPNTRVLEGMEICSTRSQFARALERAGASPLDIKVVAINTARIICTLPESSVKPRIRSLEVITEEDCLYPLKLFEDFDLSELTSFTLDSELSDLVEQVVQKASRVRYLDVSVDTLGKMTGCIWWNELEVLVVRCTGTYQDIGWLIPTLLNAAGLTSLSLEDADLPAWLSEAPIQMPSLRQLKLCSVEPIWPIDCPNLTHLTLEESSAAVAMENRTIRLPHLTEMTFTMFIAGYILRCFEVPSLVKFELGGGAGKSTNARLFRSLWPTPNSNAGHNFPVFSIRPSVLSIRNLDINSKLLARTVVYHGSLEELNIIGVDITSEFFYDLVPVQIEKRTKKPKAGDEGATWQIGCPALRVLVVDFAGRKFVKDRLDLEAGAKTLIATRTIAGSPLNRLSIRFSTNDGWREQVE